jgi:hypothetical protein
VHEVALAEDQVAIELWPEVMLVGLAESATVGCDDEGVTVPVCPNSKSILATTGGKSIGALSGSNSSVLLPETMSDIGTSIANDRKPNGAPAMAFMPARSPVVRL